MLNRAKTGARERRKEPAKRQLHHRDDLSVFRWKIERLPFVHKTLDAALAALGEIRDKLRPMNATPESVIAFRLEQMKARGCFAINNADTGQAKETSSRAISAEEYVKYCFERKFPEERTRALARYLGRDV